MGRTEQMVGVGQGGGVLARQEVVAELGCLQLITTRGRNIACLKNCYANLLVSMGFSPFNVN